MTILVMGLSRTINQLDVYERLYKEMPTLIVGIGARHGAEVYAKQWAATNQVRYEVVMPPYQMPHGIYALGWAKLHEKYPPDLVLIFHPHFPDANKATRYYAQKALENNIKVELYTHGIWLDVQTV
jgi:hypothetical protein